MSREKGDPPLASAGWGSAIGSLRNTQYRWLWMGNVSFFFAMQAVSMIIRPLIALDLTDNKPAALGMVSFAVAVPMLVLSPFGGVLADRVERRRLIMIGQGLALTGEALTLGLYVTGLLRFWHLVLLATGMGALFATMMPARQAIVVDIIGKARLGNAMALNMAGMNVTRILGPATAGFLVASLGIQGTYAGAMALYLVAWLTLIRVHPSRPPAGMRRLPVVESLSEATRYLRSERLVLLMLLFGLVPMFLMMPFQTLLPIFANDVWGTGTSGLGLLNAMAGLGGVAGSFVVALRGDTDHRLRLMLVSVFGFGVFLALFGFSPWFGLALGLLLVANVFATVFGVLNNTAVQQLIPDQVRGRISAFLMMSFSLPMLGTLPVSIAAQAYGAPLAVGVSAVLAMVVAALFCLGSPTLRGLDARVRAELDA
ncbi:MAG: MFS transporter [Proteobacteria bacterium]|nr:MFS transporter [Pseudomonadota bacterium]